MHRRGPRALVVAPTRELVVQIEENVRAYAKHLPLRMATVFGGVSERPQIDALRSGVDLVVATPGRLIDLMEQRAANLSHVEFLVLDEADRMLDMGFLPPIRQIVKALPQKRQTLMFSASALARDRRADARVPAFAQDRGDRPARQSRRDGDPVRLRSASAPQTALCCFIS